MMRSHLKFIGLVIVMGLIGYGLFSIGHRVDTLATQLQESKADRTALRAELDDQEKTSADHIEQMKALADQVKRLGGKPVVDPGEPSAPILGPVVVPQVQVNKAVSVICAGTPACRPTEAQVKTTLRAICGDCRGEDAKPPRDGIDGANGQNATITAEQIDAAVARNCGEDGCRGPGPTDEQVDERLAAYCSEHNDCRGKDAVIVPSGMDCPEGERVNGVHLLADGSLTVSCAPLIG